MSRTVHTLSLQTARHIDAIAEDTDHNCFAVASSPLSGQLWTGRVAIIAPPSEANASSESKQAEFAVASEEAIPAGVTSLAWVRCGAAFFVAAGGDDGFLHLIRAPETHLGETHKDEAHKEATAKASTKGKAKAAVKAAAKANARVEQVEMGQKAIVAHDEAVSCLHSHPARRALLLSGGADGGVKVWDFSNGFRVQKACNVHIGNVTQVQWHPTDANLFLSTGQDGYLKVSDVTKSGLVFIYDAGCPITASSWNPVNPTQIAIGLENGELRLIAVGGETSTIKTFFVHDFSIGCISFSPDGSKIASGGDDFIVSVISLADETTEKIQYHSDFVRSVVWILSGSKFDLMSGSWDGLIAVHTI